MSNAAPAPEPTPAPVDPDGVAVYRLAPLVAARFLGLYLVVFAVLLVVVTVVVSALSGPLDVLVVLFAVGLIGLFGLGWWLRARAWVVRLDPQGYAVRMVRGAGVREGAWSDVVEAVAGHPSGFPCLVLKRRDETSTTIPVEAFAEDRDDFARDVRARLEAAARR